MGLREGAVGRCSRGGGAAGGYWRAAAACQPALRLGCQWQCCRPPFPRAQPACRRCAARPPPAPAPALPTFSSAPPSARAPNPATRPGARAWLPAALNSEQKALLDFIVLARAKKFVGFGSSTFSFFLREFRALHVSPAPESSPARGSPLMLGARRQGWRREGGARHPWWPRPHALSWVAGCLHARRPAACIHGDRTNPLLASVCRAFRGRRRDWWTRPSSAPTRCSTLLGPLCEAAAAPAAAAALPAAPAPGGRAASAGRGAHVQGRVAPPRRRGWPFAAAQPPQRASPKASKSFSYGRACASTCDLSHE